MQDYIFLIFRTKVVISMNNSQGTKLLFSGVHSDQLCGIYNKILPVTSLLCYVLSVFTLEFDGILDSIVSAVCVVSSNSQLIKSPPAVILTWFVIFLLTQYTASIYVEMTYCTLEVIEIIYKVTCNSIFADLVNYLLPLSQSTCVIHSDFLQIAVVQSPLDKFSERNCIFNHGLFGHRMHHSVFTLVYLWRVWISACMLV